MQVEAWNRILSDWKTRVSSYQTGQYEQSTHLEKRHYQLGIPAVVLAAIAGTISVRQSEQGFFDNCPADCCNC
jgi:hypothetical protein